MVILKKKIYVYNFLQLKVMESFDTSPNPRGICAMNGSKEMCVFASPHSKEGTIQVIHFDRANKSVLINSHLSPVTALALNQDGSLLATASQKGQIIRIFVTETGQQIQELRRGTDEADIISLAFDPVSKYISCSSDKGTVHIFSIRNDVSLAATTHKQL